MTQKAVTETIRICKDRNILKEYLLDREKKVVTIMMRLFDEEQIMKSFIKSERHDADRETAENNSVKTHGTINYKPCVFFCTQKEKHERQHSDQHHRTINALFAKEN